MEEKKFEWKDLRAATIDLYVRLQSTKLFNVEIMFEGVICTHSNNGSVGYEKAWDELVNRVKEMLNEKEVYYKKNLNEALLELKSTVEEDIGKEEHDLEDLKFYKMCGDEIELYRKELLYIKRKREKLQRVENPNWMRKLLKK